MNMRFIGLVASLVLLAAAGVAVVPEAAEGLPVARIGIVTDGPWPRHPEAIDLFQKEILAMTAGQFDVRFPASLIKDGGETVAGINRALDSLLSDPKVALVLTLGPVASHEVSKRRKLAKPVVAPFVIDAQIQNLPFKAGTSGVKNLCYIDSLKRVGRAIEVFQEVTPFGQVTILADDLVLKAVPELRQGALKLIEEQGLKVELVGVEASAEQALAAISLTAEAVFVGPLWRLTPAEFQKLVTGLTERRLPSFSLWGRDEVEQGLLAGMAPEASLQYLARTVAINVQDILGGQNAGTLSVTFSPGEHLTINMATARAINVYPGWNVITEADLLNLEGEEAGRELTLEMVVKEALQVNLDLAVADRHVVAGEQQVKETRAQLLPQVAIGTQAIMIDDDRATASGGLNPERRWTGTADATQLLYSDKAWKHYSVQKHLQASRVEEREALRLDTIKAAATAYLRVLTMRTSERIQRDNLKLTRANLQRARVRESVGIAGPDEVYRWESEIANRLQQVLNARSRTLSAMNSLNRVINRPLDELFVPKEAEHRDPTEIIKGNRLLNYVNNPSKIRIFGDFMVQEGLAAAPELRGLDAEIFARERTLAAAKRSFWLPTFLLQGNVTETFKKGGSGSGPTAWDDTDWQAGVYASLPLFEGGGRMATLKRTREELSRLQIRREALADRIEERILRAVNRLRASFPSIRLSRDAAEAARSNLKLVTDSYARGTKSIIDLLDAQNLAMVADERAANAAYICLDDLMRVQRAVGSFTMFVGEEEKRRWLEKLETFSKNREEPKSN